MTKRTTLLILFAVGCATPAPATVAAGAGDDDDAGAVTATVIGVAHHIDAKEWPALRGLFAADVETDYTSLFGGEVQQQSGDALISAWTGLLTPVVTQHLLGPVHVDVTGDVATARCHVRGYHFVERAPGGPTWMVAGHYVFRLRRAEGRWAITHLKLETYYQTGNTRLLQEAAALPKG